MSSTKNMSKHGSIRRQHNNGERRGDGEEALHKWKNWNLGLALACAKKNGRKREALQRKWCKGEFITAPKGFASIEITLSALLCPVQQQSFNLYLLPFLFSFFKNL